MAINGIGNNGYYGVNTGYYNYQSSINQLKFQNSINKAGGIFSGNSAISKSFRNSSADFLKTYNSSMSDLLSAANKLKASNRTGVLNDLTAASSDTDVVNNVESAYKLSATESYNVQVQQLASSQVNTSEAVQSNAIAKDNASLSIVTEKGTFSVNVGNVGAYGAKKTNADMMKDIAEEINKQDMGVTASVVTKDGKSSLEIKGDKTGADKSFTVNGEYAKEMGLTEASAKAKDAVYSVTTGNKTTDYTSSTNDITLSNGQIKATLAKEGSAEISVGVGDKDIVSAMEDLVDSYNDTIKMLGNNVERGSGVERQLAAMVRPPISERSMALVGLSQNKDGTLSLDTSKLRESLKDDPKLARDIIGGSTGIAEGVLKDAQKGLSTSSSSLLNYDIENAKLENLMDSTNFLSRYTKSGVYNMSNYYALGMMINYLV